MMAASRFDDVSDEYLSSLLDKSFVFTVLLIVFYQNNNPEQVNQSNCAILGGSRVAYSNDLLLYAPHSI